MAAPLPTARSSQKNLVNLRQRLAQVTGAWSTDDYKAFITFYSGILPELMRAERCTIFMMEPGGNKIWSIFGTGLEEERIEPPLEGFPSGDLQRDTDRINTIIEGWVRERPEQWLWIHKRWHTQPNSVREATDAD